MLFIVAAVIGIGLAFVYQKRKGRESSKTEIGSSIGIILGVVIALLIGYLL